MRSQMIFAAAVVMSMAAVPAFANSDNSGPLQGGPTVESPSTVFSGFGEGYQPNNEATARWCQDMAAAGHNRGHAYASWCAQQQPNG